MYVSLSTSNNVNVYCTLRPPYFQHLVSRSMSSDSYHRRPETESEGSPDFDPLDSDNSDFASLRDSGHRHEPVYISSSHRDGGLSGSSFDSSLMSVNGEPSPLSTTSVSPSSIHSRPSKRTSSSASSFLHPGIIGGFVPPSSSGDSSIETDSQDGGDSEGENRNVAGNFDGHEQGLGAVAFGQQGHIQQPLEEVGEVQDESKLWLSTESRDLL